MPFWKRDTKTVVSEGDPTTAFDSTSPTIAAPATLEIAPSKEIVPGETDLEKSGGEEEAVEVEVEGNMFELKEPLSRTRFVLVFVALSLSVFLFSLDQTIVAPAVPKIAGEFLAFDEVSWIGTAYMLTSTAFQPMYGKFSDIFGRQPVILTCLVIFMIGSLGCALAPSIIVLAIFRAIAGIGGGGLITISTVIVTDIVPAHQRAKYQGFIGAIYAFSSVFGPLLGGVFTDHVTWRWCFYINLPIGALAILVLATCVQLPRPRGTVREKLGRIDYLGSFLLVLAIVALLLPMGWGGGQFAWDSAVVIALFCVSGVLFGAFALVEWKWAGEPIMPGRMFRIPNQVAIYASNFFMGTTFFSLVYYFPVFYQVVRGDSATTSGLRLLPLLLVASFVVATSGYYIMRLSHRGFQVLIAGGLALFAIATGFFRDFGVVGRPALENAMLVLAGLGCGVTFQTATIASQITAPDADMAIATTLGNFARIIGGVIGIAIGGAVYNNDVNTKIPPVLAANGVTADVHGSVTYISELADGLRQEVIGLYADAFRDLFTVLIPLACLACICGLFVRVKREHFAKLSKVEVGVE